MTGDRTLTYPLTDEEKALVEQYHNIIWKVMSDMRLPRVMHDDLYDIAALALMAAARKYQVRNELRKRVSFTTVAYQNIRSAIKAELRVRLKHGALSLDCKNDDGMPMYNSIPVPEYTPENSPETIEAYNAVAQMLTPKELECVTAASNHVTSAEYNKMYNCKGNCMSGIFAQARKKCFARYCEIFHTDTPEERPVRRRPVTDEEHTEILRLHHEGLNAVQIGRIVGRNPNVISRRIKKSRQAAT